MANAGAKLSSFPEVNDIQTGDMFPLLSGGNTNAKIDYATLADAIIADETDRAKKAEEANTQLTNDLKTGLTSGTVKVAKATSADSATALGKVSTYQTFIPDNGGRMKYLLMYDITDWISAKSNASTRAFDGYFFSRRSDGYVDTNYTGNLSIVASYNGVRPDGSPIKSDNGISLRLRTTSSTYVPKILHQKSNDKYYLSLMTGGPGRDLILFGIFQGTFIGTWINNEGANFTNGTLPSDYEEYSDGFYSISYEKAICDKNGKDITEYLVAAAYADGAFTFTRGNGDKTVLTIPDTVSNTVNSHIANKSNPHVVTKAQVGLGSVANLDQSKAIKSITRNGTTFTATALDGTTSTFTQQDNNTTYGLASQSSNGLMSAADKKAIDREFFRMLPKGGTVIPNGANLNSTAYLKVGNYYQSAIVNTTNMTNIPIKIAFMMYVLSPLSETYDNESTDQWVYRLRIFVGYDGNNIFVQMVSSGTTAGSFDYGPWVKMTNSNDLGAVSKIINDHIANKSNPHGVTKAQVGLGSVANIDQSKAIKSITRSGTTFTATALDGTTTTFTQQDNNTTYDIATSSADGLMSKTDKAKLDGISSGADASPIKAVQVNGTALTPDSNKAVNVTVPTLANNATTTAGGMALDARMGKTLADQASQLAKNTAQIETAGTATSAHSAGEYVMISNALYKVTASVAKGDTWTIGTNVTAANIGSEIGSLKSDLANHSALHALSLSDIADAQNGFNIQSCHVAIQGKIVLCWLTFGMNNISIPQWKDFAFAKLKSGYYPAKTGSFGPVGIIQEQTSGLTGVIRVIDNVIYIDTHAISFNSGGWCWGFVAYVLA